MKKIILNLAVASSLIIGIAACNSTKEAGSDTDSTIVDSTEMMQDTTVKDTNLMKAPDTTKQNRPL